MNRDIEDDINDVLSTLGGRTTVSKLRVTLMDSRPHVGRGHCQATLEADLERRGYTVYMSHDGNNRRAVYVCRGSEQHPREPPAPAREYVVSIRGWRVSDAYISRFRGGPIMRGIGYARVWSTRRGADLNVAKCGGHLQAVAVSLEAES